MRLQFSRLVLLGSLGLAVAGCGSGQERLSALDAADVRFPSAELLRESGGDGYDDILGYQGARLVYSFGTTASVEDVHAFYDAALTSNGWSRTIEIRSTREVAAYGFQRANVALRLDFHETDPSSVFPTMYDMRITELRSGEPSKGPSINPTALAAVTYTVPIILTVLAVVWLSGVGLLGCLGRFVIALAAGLVLGLFTLGVVWSRARNEGVFFEAPLLGLLGVGVGTAMTGCLIGLVSYVGGRRHRAESRAAAGPPVASDGTGAVPEGAPQLTPDDVNRSRRWSMLPPAGSPIPPAVVVAGWGLLLQGGLSLFSVLVGVVVLGGLRGFDPPSGWPLTLGLTILPAIVTLWAARGAFRGSRLAHAVAIGVCLFNLQSQVAYLVFAPEVQASIGLAEVIGTATPALILGCLVWAWKWFWRPERATN